MRRGRRQDGLDARTVDPQSDRHIAFSDCQFAEFETARLVQHIEKTIEILGVQ